MSPLRPGQLVRFTWSAVYPHTQEMRRFDGMAATVLYCHISYPSIVTVWFGDAPTISYWNVTPDSLTPLLKKTYKITITRKEVNNVKRETDVLD